MTSPPSSFTPIVPSDCMSNVLSYLPLHDCLSYASTCLSALHDASGADMVRRRRLMTRKSAWRVDFSQSVTAPGGRRPFVLTSCCDNAETDDSRSRCEEEQQSVLLPSIRSRLECLVKVLSESHPQHVKVNELLNDIIQHQYLADEEADEQRSGANSHYHTTVANNLQNKSQSELQFQSVLSKFQAAMKAHKLHATILRDATISNDLFPVDGSAALSDHNAPKLTVTLDRYLGDVLIACFFMGHVVSGTMEQGAAAVEERWINKLLTDLHLDADSLSPTLGSKGNIAVDAWYRLWIFLHSSVLRTAPFSSEQRALLGLGMEEEILQKSSSSSSSSSFSTVLKPPPFPYVGVDKKPIMALISQRERTSAMMSSSLRITLNEFGRLGPSTFRGRDNVQSQVVHQASPIGAIVSFDGFPPSLYASPFLDGWRDGTDPGIKWLLDVHSECGNVRPMTVIPPLVTIVIS